MFRGRTGSGSNPMLEFSYVGTAESSKRKRESRKKILKVKREEKFVGEVKPVSK